MRAARDVVRPRLVAAAWGVLLAAACAGRSIDRGESERGGTTGAGASGGNGNATNGGTSSAASGAATSTGGTTSTGDTTGGTTSSHAGGSGMTGGAGGNGAGGTAPIVIDPFCGNGVPEGFEECDDGNLTGADGCTMTCHVERDAECPRPDQCHPPVCGDGKVARTYEACDDGNGTNGDGCSVECAVEPGWLCPAPGVPCRPVCGDGSLVGSEECDPGMLDGDRCSPTCRLACADQPSGGAGSGSEAGPSGVPTGCAADVCGDGVVTGVEECDEGKLRNDGHYGGCRSDCRYAAYCGDGFIDGTEECDDNFSGLYSNTGEYACTPACLYAGFCGDGAIDANFGEQCDEGDRNGHVLTCAAGCIIYAR